MQAQYSDVLLIVECFTVVVGILNVTHFLMFAGRINGSKYEMLDLAFLCSSLCISPTLAPFDIGYGPTT
jgi:hypothetical protein